MTSSKIVEELLDNPSHNSLITFQSFIRNNTLTSQEIRIIQRAFTASLKENEKENCDLILEAIQVFIQKYYQHLMEWLYILIVQLTHRQSSASNDSHTRALQETTDLIRNLFPQKLLLQLSCKFVMDSIQIMNSTVKFHLLQFIRVLVVSSKPEILENTFPDLIMAVSRIISWTADVKSTKVRKEAERVIQKLFYLNPERFSAILKPLPAGFQDRAKIILKGNTCKNIIDVPKTKLESTIPDNIQIQESNKNVNSINFSKTKGFYPKPGLLERAQIMCAPPVKHINEDAIVNKVYESSNESTPKKLSGNCATVTYSDTHLIRHNFKRMSRYDKLLENSPQNRFDTTDSGDRVKIKKPRSRRSKKLKHWDNIKLTTEDIKSSDNSQHPSKFSNKGVKKYIHKSSKTQADDTQDVETILKDVTNKLSRFNERHQERKLSLLVLIKLINSNEKKCWDIHFKIIMSLLLETLGDNEGGTRKLALVSIQELAKVEPERFQDQILVVVEKLLHCFLDTDQGVIEAVKSCALTFSCYLNVDTLWRTLNSILVDSEEFIQSVGLKFMSYIIRSSTPVIVSCLLIETLSLLNKFTLEKNMQLRKNSIYCLITLYKKIGDKIWPNLKNFEKTTVRLLQIYIHRL